MKPHLRLLLLLLMAGVLPIWGQDAPSSDVRERMEAFFADISDFNRRYPQEKVYLHFDNTAYFLTETIWFKAYVVQASDHVPTRLSGVLYVELLSPEGAVLETKKLPVVDGGCHGEFYLDSLYLSGYYEVRAYTRYMLNFGPDAVFSRVFPVYKNVPDGEYFRKTILDRDLSRRERVKDIHYQSAWLLSRVAKPGKRMREKYYFPEIRRRTAEQRRNEIPLSQVFDAETEKPDKKNLPEVTFCPEGGNLLADVRQKTAFNITDGQGRGVETSVQIICDRRILQKGIKTDAYGNGTFYLQTNPDHPYFLAFSHEGKLHRFKLPSPQATGVALALSQDDGQLDVQILQTGGTDSILALALSAGGTFHRFELLRPGDCPITLHTDSFPEGVNTASLFAADGRVLSERKFFVRHTRPGYVSLLLSGLSGQTALDPYQPINLSLSIGRSDSTAIPSCVSLSVRDEENTEPSFENGDLYTHLLLASELHGFLPDIAWFFEQDTPDRRSSLDNLLLIRGWTRYVWEEMSLPQVAFWEQPVERNLMVDGRVFKYKDFRHPCLKNAPLGFSAIEYDSIEFFGTIQTNDIGRYAVQLNSFYGEGELHVSLRDLDEQPRHIVTFNRWYSPKPKTYSYYELNFPYSRRDGLHSPGQAVHDSLINVNLAEASVSRRSFRRHVRHNYSLRHYNIAEELEYMLDVYQIPLETYFRRPDSLVLCLMHRYNFPPCVFNTVFAESYPGDTVVPEGRLYWQDRHYRKDILGMKEIVIRSDKAVTERYHVSSQGVPLWLLNDYIESDRSMLRPTRFKLPEYTGTDYPDCVAFFIPYDRGRESHPIIPRTVGTRFSKFQGYAPSADFPAPDYGLWKLTRETAGVSANKPPLPDLPPDYRRTLYWNPDVPLSADGTAHVEFYNNATCRHLSISAEGITPDGAPVILESH